MTDTTKTPEPGDLRVWYIPQMPMRAFHVAAPDLPTAALILDTLERFSLFEYENRVKPDYADMGGISRWEEDGDGGYDWFDVDDFEIHALTTPTEPTEAL